MSKKQNRRKKREIKVWTYFPCFVFATEPLKSSGVPPLNSTAALGLSKPSKVQTCLFLDQQIRKRERERKKKRLSNL